MLLLLLAPCAAFAQVQLWQETFNGLTNGSTSDAGATSWSTVLPSGGSASFSKQTPVAGYQVFLINNTGSEGVWKSQSINIAAYPEVALEIGLYSYYTFSTDYIRCYYKINDGPEILFGELLGSNGLNITSAASAIVSGNTVQIVIRAMDNTQGSNSDLGVTVPNAMAVDDITLTSISVLYSRSSGNWNNTNTWSSGGFTGTSCGCTPAASHRVIIGNNRTVSIPNAATSAGITIEDGARLQFTGNTSLTIARGGRIDVRSGGTLSQNGNDNASIVYNAYNYNLNVEGTLSIGFLDANAGSNISLSGSGTLSIANDFTIGSGRTITNNISGEVTVGDELIFEPGSVNANFTNAGTLSVNNRILFNAGNITFTNNGIMSASNGIIVNDNADDGNIFVNGSESTLNVSQFDLNNADFTLNNSGVINQTGNFTDISGGTMFSNLDGGTWNFGGGGTNTRLFCSAGTNIFHYNASADQPIFAPADGAYSNLKLSGSGIKSASASLDINKSLSIESMARLDVTSSSHPIRLAGDWIISGTHADPFLHRAGTVIFDGTGDQYIHSLQTGGETFHNLAVDKITGDVVLANSTSINVSNNLTLTSGGIDLNGSILNITSGSASAITRTNGYIKSESTTPPYGQLKWSTGTGTGAYVFPFGKSTASSDYIPFTFDITSAGSGSGTVSVSTYSTSPSNAPLPSGVTDLSSSPGTDNSPNTVDRFWYITVDGYTSNPVSTVTFTATPDEVGAISSLRAQRWNAVASKWDAPLMSQSNPDAYSVRVPGVSNFSPWTLSGNNIVLPVTLISFDATIHDNQVQIEWTTMQETDNDFFTIEKTRDFETFFPVGKVKASGTSKSKRSYHITDDNPFGGTAYYRLKQTDLNGHTTTFKPVMLQYDPTEAIIMDVFPVPCDGNWIQLSINGLKDSGKIPVAVYDATGRTVYSAFVDIGRDGQSRRLLFSNSLEPGVYTLKAGPLLSLRRKIVVE